MTAYCTACKNSAGAGEAAELPQCVGGRSTLGEQLLREVPAELDQLLQQWTRQPAPRTAVHAPRPLRRRVATLVTTAMAAAAGASAVAAAAAGSLAEQAARAQELRAHRTMWALPSNLRSLLTEAIAARDDVGPRPAAAGPGESQATAELRLQGAAVRKTLNGCLRSAAQLLVQKGAKAPPTQATVQATWQVLALQPPDDAGDAGAYAQAQTAVATMPMPRIAPQAVKQAMAAARAGAEPGPSGWREG